MNTLIMPLGTIERDLCSALAMAGQYHGFHTSRDCGIDPGADIIGRLLEQLPGTASGHRLIVMDVPYFRCHTMPACIAGDEGKTLPGKLTADQDIRLVVERARIAVDPYDRKRLCRSCWSDRGTGQCQPVLGLNVEQLFAIWLG